MSEILETIVSRRSVRQYTSDPVSQEDIDQVIKAGLYAPSGRGAQSPIIIAVTDRTIRDQLSRMNARIMGKEDFDPFYGAPVVLIVLADKNIPTCVYDGSLAIGNMMLAAHDLQLGSCWIHRAKQEFESEEGQALLRKLGIDDHYEGIGHVILGHTDVSLSVPERKENRVFYLK